jgi:hypothetical protein
VTLLPLQGLGDEAWPADVTGGSEGALFLWRRQSLVVVADMSCDETRGLESSRPPAPYADAIDERAKDTP